MVRAHGVAEVTDQDFGAEVLGERGRPVLVEFTADWCGPCRQLAPVLSALAAEEADRLKVVQIDADSNPDTVTRYGVLSMPTLLVFQDGEPVKSMVGARAKRRLLAELEDVIGVRAGAGAGA
ncbi:thioredoxin family protein [Streptomyces bambusae]|uniref:Thioredoxin n=1 Tax=Streptomyces bambusae TaxID=1550616 RepID=A0ABS6Z5R6_9ACTN|nr:thioredoxin domain-containing protein [Streptomyces bambusae]MBW5483115.1 thioredoxin fold domain-containing protein [Streptomyces bambusae]